MTEVTVTQEDREAFKAFRELLFKPRVGEEGFCLMDIEAGLQWVARHRIAAIEATKEACARGVESDDATQHCYCCTGRECGCQGITLGDWLAHHIRDLTATDIMKRVGR